MGAVDFDASASGMGWQTQRVFPQDQWPVRLRAVGVRLSKVVIEGNTALRQLVRRYGILSVK